MERALHVVLTVGLIVVSCVCQGAEKIEIILDTSAGMWDTLSSGTPRVLAARNAINAFVASPAVRDLRLEIGLRIVGGETDLGEGLGCSDNALVMASRLVEPAEWSTTLSNLHPRGRRALVSAIEEAVENLNLDGGTGRIIIITSGADECNRDISTTLEEIADSEKPLSIRIIGIDIDHALSSSLIKSAPTRNSTNAAELDEMLQWAILPQGIGGNRPEWLELNLSDGDLSATGATLFVVNLLTGEELSTPIENGVARLRAAPGLYRARIEGSESGVIELARFAHLGNDEALEMDLSPAPEVTLEVGSESSLAGGTAFVQYWGAPPGTNWVGITTANTPNGEYVALSPAGDSTGEVALVLPDSPNELEVHFTREIGPGVQQILGRLPFNSNRRRVSLEAPERAEIKTQLTISWNGLEIDGDHITIATQGTTNAESVHCSPSTGNKPVTFTAPAIPGDYIVRFLSRRGRTLARTDLNVFEVLATLDGPTEIGPGEDLSVEWTGPDAPHDYLSISEVGEDNDAYQSFTPASSGNPGRLRAPKIPGDYEIRYVRSEDGKVLASQPLAVVTIRVTLDVPESVEAGTRFEVAWNGTAGKGDFIAVARPRTGRKKHLDWSFTNLGSPVTLAAPFDQGQYVVRYVSGSTQKIIARAKIEVR